MSSQPVAAGAVPFTSPATGASSAATQVARADEASPTSSGDALAAATTDFETFLTLLTAQMQNQDPLKPVESTEFVAQLASFSAVEQQIGTNDRLDALLEAMTGGAGAGLSEWIGRDVRAAAPVRFDGGQVDVFTSPPSGATAAALVVRDASGTPVARMAVDPTAERLSWSGQLPNGGTATDGVFSFEVEYASENGPISATSGEVFDRVVEVRLGAGADPVLGLAGGGEVSADAVSVLRAAAPATADQT